VHRVGEIAENQRKTREKYKVAENPSVLVGFMRQKKDPSVGHTRLRGRGWGSKYRRRDIHSGTLYTNFFSLTVPCHPISHKKFVICISCVLYSTGTYSYLGKKKTAVKKWVERPGCCKQGRVMLILYLYLQQAANPGLAYGAGEIVSHV
jgi:hypothetical protein